MRWLNWTYGVVHANVGQNVTPHNPSLGLFVYHFLHTMSLWCCESIHNNTNNQQTPPPWWWSHLPLQWCGFDESMLPDGQVALSTCSSVVGNFGGHGGLPVRYKSNCLMQHVQGYSGSHWMHRATNRSVLPQRPPRQQQTKWQQQNVPIRLLILMAAAVRRYDTACIAQ